MENYANLRTIPALLGIIFAIASFYQFGAIAEVHFPWFEYTLTTQHAMFIALGAYAIAFASSETRQFENYENWEKGFIAAGPAVIILHQYSEYFQDLMASNDPALSMVAVLIALAGWGVAVQ